MVLILTTLSYIGTRALVQRNAQLQLHEAAETVAAPIIQALDVAAREVHTLARQSLFANALLDSEGRGAYLRPYLAKHELAADIDYNLVLTDFRGEPLAARKELTSYRDETWFQGMLQQGKGHTGIKMIGPRGRLQVAMPILYEYSGTYEGALVLDTDLTAWLNPEQDALPRSLGIASLELLAGGAVVSSHVMSTPPKLVSFTVPINAKNLALDPPLELRVSMDESQFARHVDEQLVSHIVIGLFAILAVVVISSMLARAQTRRIEILAQEARSIALTGRSSISLTDGRFGNDEVSDLATGLSNLLHELKSRGMELESQVAQRTAELNRAQHIAKIGSWSVDLVTRAMSWSPETYRIFGIPPETSVHLDSFLDCVAPDDRDRVNQALQAALITGRFDVEHRILAPGIRRHVHSVGEIVYSREGKPLQAVGTTRDITTEREAAQALVDSDSYNKALFEGSHIPLVIMDPGNGRFVDCNSAAVAIYGMAGPENVIGKTPLDVATPVQYDGTPSAEAAARHIEAALKEGSVLFEWRHQRPNGEQWDAEVRLMSFRHKDKILLQFGLQDISERKRTEARMIEALVVFNASNQGIMTTDEKGLIVSVNPAFCTITGYAPEEAIGRTAAFLRSGRHDNNFYQAMWISLETKGSWEGEIWNRRKNGEIYPQWLSISAVHDEKTGAVLEHVALFSDISERKKQEEVVWRQANYDALTHLANRNLLHDRLEQALAHARRNSKKVGLLFLDLDGFKWINDTLGHDAGDELLVEVARRLQATIRQEDTVARLGGDEFTVVVQHLGQQDSLEGIGEKIVTVLRQPFNLSSGVQHISGSVGIAVYPDDAGDAPTLMRCADIAMYQSKQAGKNRFQFFAKHMQIDAQARVQMEADLRTALDSQAFSLHYQPILDARSGKLVAAEALLRWQHAERGDIPPQEFIPVAEDSGLIVPIGEWVLREAARQWNAWRADGHPPLRLTVNVSGIQFGDAKLQVLLAGLMDEFRIEPGCLVLEITESVLMESSEAAESRMRDIKTLGIGYALDDFGTGFSSLSYLKSFPVDMVKIDRSFVRDCPDDPSDAHLVEAIINMAHSLNLKVAAEGVETESQLHFLRQLGCDFLQGYLISRAVPAREFEHLWQAPLLKRLATEADPAESWVV